MVNDFIVIGSGIGGLSCAALLARYGFKVTVCESHSLAGGAAHGFERGGFIFDSGPSLYSGLSYSPSLNPLKQVLDILEESLPCVTYDTWGCCLPEGDFKTSVGADQFCEVLRQLRGETAVIQWRQLQAVMKPLGRAAVAIPPASFRFDSNALFTMGRFLPNALFQGSHLFKLTGSFSAIADTVISDPFIRNWLDLLCFLLSGLPAKATSAAEMAFMFADWYRPGVMLDYPLGGSGALVKALVRGLEKFGGQIRYSSHVKEIVVENKRAVGVSLSTGEIIHAKEGVISNASIWDTLKLIPPHAVASKWRNKREKTPACESFLHLHLGIDGTNLPQDLACHYIVVNDWSKGVKAPQNVVLVSIPSLLDSTLAPPGKQTIHVYTPGNEPYSLWDGMKRGSLAYQQQKQQRAAVMWQALERIIPDIRSRCEITLMGTPLTHERFLRRMKGSYGPAIAAGKELFPGPKTPLSGLWCCGDSTFPGIGLPAVAASGMMVANTFASVSQQLKMLQKII
ncbi:MAG: NAD(P)/FAD-dependent oxidoreductase [Crocosphaera sp.]|nr:NAD(P)/FAD-dependent oxidoreductase [Crocosphaera sp.]